MLLGASFHFSPPFLGFGAVGTIISIWALVDTATRPDWAFRAAGHSKGLWIALEIVGIFVCCGLIIGLVYLIGIRGSVVRAASASGPPDWSMPPPQAPPAPGWYPDPGGPGMRYWDGLRWTDQRQG